MKISYVSDLHLEFRSWPNFSKEEGGDVLLLAGDIFTAQLFRLNRTDSDARKFHKYLKVFKSDLLDKYSKVYYVMGNHEHYNSIFKNTAKELKAGFEKHDLAINLLDNDLVKLSDDVNLIGCTLWSNYENNNPNSKLDCQYGMNDYRLIGAMDVDDMNYFNRYSSRLATPDMFLAEFDRSVAYIREILNQQGNKKTVIMTHHAPSLVSLNKEHVGNGMDGAYASDLSDLILSYPQIKYWVHGHTHQNVDYSVGDYTKVLANQCGYPFEKCNKLFKGLKHFEV